MCSPVSHCCTEWIFTCPKPIRYTRCDYFDIWHCSAAFISFVSSYFGGLFCWSSSHQSSYLPLKADWEQTHSSLFGGYAVALKNRITLKKYLGAAEPCTWLYPLVEGSFPRKVFSCAIATAQLYVCTAPALFLLLPALENLSWGLLIGLSILI